MSHLRVAVPFLLALCLISPVSAIAGYQFSSYDAPGSNNTQFYGINNAGQIAGQYVDTNFNTQSFVYFGGNYAPFNVSGATTTLAMGINNSGQVVGSYNANNSQFGFVQGVYPQINFSAFSTQANGANTSGQVVGTYLDSTFTNQGFLYNGSKFTSLDSTTVPTIASNTVVTITPFGINDKGVIVGTYTDTNNGQHGFIRDAAGNYTSVDDPALPGSIQFNGINKSGAIVGYGFDFNGNEHSFVYSGGQFTPLDYPGAGFTYAQGINDAGQIVGYYSDDLGQHGFLASPSAVPEPASLTLTLAGCLVGFVVHRRRAGAGSKTQF